MLWSVMVPFLGSASSMIPLTQNSYASRRIGHSVAPVVITSVFRRGSSSIRTFKAKAMGCREEEEPRFPPQNQDSQPRKEYLMDPLPIFDNPFYKPSNKLKGKVALVTGGDSGIGRAVCDLFSKEGATVAFTYVKGPEDIDAANTLKIINDSKMNEVGEPIAIHTDLSFEKNCKEVVDEVVAKYGRIDVLVNNAAVIYETYSLDEITEERLQKIFRINIFSHFFLVRHAVKHMKEGSSIINTTSAVAYIGNAQFLDYASTKGAVLSFIRSLALFLVDKGIRVNGVAPGPVWTPLIAAGFSDEDIATFGSDVPMNRAGQPVEIAPAYLFLASKEASYITGQVLHPNGGQIVNA